MCKRARHWNRVRFQAEADFSLRPSGKHSVAFDPSQTFDRCVFQKCAELWDRGCSVFHGTVRRQHRWA